MDDELLWRQVMDRDRDADGRFVFAVRSTGIYCRPSCPSRRPRRTQVVFFPAPTAAERAGFRPCRRCRPDRAASDVVEKVRRVCAWMAANPHVPPTLARLGRLVETSPFHLQRMFQRVLGVSPREYAEARRTERLKARLRTGARVAAALYDAGYGASSRLYERAGAELGMTPGTYRRGGRGMVIHYVVVGSSLGRLLVGATDRGVCSVKLGDRDQALEADLRKEYPAAALVAGADSRSPWVAALVAYLDGTRQRPDVPTDVAGTAFQRRVWRYLQRIPPGQTRSYGQVARALGQPAAARAVARACATNPVALVFPCHRVVPVAGGTGGYRWGAGRKEALLELERGQSRMNRARGPR